MEAKRKLKKVTVDFISLVTRGANKKQIMYKTGSEGDHISKTVPIRKLDEEKHLVYGIVYSPDETDLQGDTASGEVIEKMAHSFMKEKKNCNVDKQHNFDPVEGYVAESWILKSPDPVFPGEKEGSWAVAIKIENESTWGLIKSGEIAGLSLAGFAEVEEMEKDGIIAKIKKLLGMENNANVRFTTREEEAGNSSIEKQMTTLTTEMEKSFKSLTDLINQLTNRVEEIEKTFHGSAQKTSQTKAAPHPADFDWFSGINEL